MLWRLCLALLCTWLMAAPAEAIDLYRIQFGNCQVSEGIIVGIDGKVIKMLQLDSRYRTIPIRQVKQVALYQSQENPLQSFTAGANELLEVTAESEHEPFIGFAIGFYDELVMFIDQEGHTRILEFHDIISLKPFLATKGKGDSPKNISSRATVLVQPPGRGICKQQPSPPAQSLALLSRQIIAGKLQLETFFERMRKGYQEIDGLRERLYLYYKPIVFDQKSRLGLVNVATNWNTLFKMTPNGTLETIPAYFEIGSGKSYRFQSSTAFGLKSWDATPTLLPVFGAQSRFKSHLLQGILVGNMQGLTAGKSLYYTGWEAALNKQKNREKTWAALSFNHLTLLGFDYRNFSMSYGYYFPVFAFGEKEEFREIVASSSSKVWRIAWQEPKWQTEWLLYYTNTRSESNYVAGFTDPAQTEEDNAPLLFYSNDYIPKTFRVRDWHMRINTTYQWTTSIVSGLSLLIGQTNYEENTIKRDVPLYDTTSSNTTAETGSEEVHTIKQNSLGLTTYVRWDFGRWVAIRLEGQIEQQTTSGSLMSSHSSGTVSDNISTYLAGLEFLL